LSKEEDVEVRVEVHARNRLADLGKFKIPFFSNSLANFFTHQKPIDLDAASTFKNCTNSRVSRFFDLFRFPVSVSVKKSTLPVHGTAT
jgi:hypothetical protein